MADKKDKTENKNLKPSNDQLGENASGEEIKFKTQAKEKKGKKRQ